MSGAESESPSTPSIDVVRAEVDLCLGELERRGGALDSRAGLILGFGGILIGVSSAHSGLPSVVGQLFAAVAAAVAGSALWPRLAASVEVRSLTEEYVREDPSYTKEKLLDSRVWLYEEDEARLEQKVVRLKFSAWILSAAVLVVLSGAIVDTFHV